MAENTKGSWSLVAAKNAVLDSLKENWRLLSSLAIECRFFLQVLRKNSPQLFYSMLVVLAVTSTMPFALSYYFGRKLDALNDHITGELLTVLILGAWGLLQIAEQFEAQFGRKVEEFFRTHYVSRLMRLRIALGLRIFEKQRDKELAKDMTLADQGEYWGPRLLQYMIFMFAGSIRTLCGATLLLSTWFTQSIIPLLALIPLVMIRLRVAVKTAQTERQLADDQGRITHLRGKYNDPFHFKAILLLSIAYPLANYVIDLLRMKTKKLNRVYDLGIRAEILVTVLLVSVLYFVLRMMSSQAAAGGITIGKFSLFWMSLLACIEGLDRTISNLSDMCARVDQLSGLRRTEEKYAHLIVQEDPQAVRKAVADWSGQVGQGALSIRGLTFGYKINDPLFENAGVALKPGLTFVLGTNGAGKTTLCDLISNLQTAPPDAIFVGSVDTTEIPPTPLRRIVVHGAQKPTTFRGLTYRLPFSFIDEEAAKDDELVFNCLDWASIGGLVRERGLDTDDSVWGNRNDTFEFSGGYSARYSLALSRFQMLTGAKLVMFDEPFANLDGPTIEEYLARMRKLEDEGISALLIVHSAHLVNNNDNVLFVHREERNGKPIGTASLSAGTKSELMESDPQFLAFVERRRHGQPAAV